MSRVFIFLIVILLPMFSFGETIELKNGKTIEGKIIDAEFFSEFDLKRVA